ncbi:hypothetical protein ACFQX7_39240 [Luedemannella flava]
MPRALDAVGRGAPVLLLGTGLTAVDVVLSLAEAGHLGPVTAVSRHGLLPRAHGPAAPPVTLRYETRLRPWSANCARRPGAATGGRSWTACGRTSTRCGPASTPRSRTRSCGTWPGTGRCTGTGWRPWWPTRSTRCARRGG